MRSAFAFAGEMVHSTSMRRCLLPLLFLFGCALETGMAEEQPLRLDDEGWVDVQGPASFIDVEPSVLQQQALPDLDPADLPGRPAPQAFCPRPAAGCECIPGSAPVSCLMPADYTNCGLGTRYCRDGVWSECWHVNYVNVP